MTGEGGNEATNSTGAVQVGGSRGTAPAVPQGSDDATIERGRSQKAVPVVHPLPSTPPPAASDPVIVPLGETAQGGQLIARVRQVATLPFTGVSLVPWTLLAMALVGLGLGLRSRSAAVLS